MSRCQGRLRVRRCKAKRSFGPLPASARSRGSRCALGQEPAFPAISCSTRISCRSGRSRFEIPDIGPLAALALETAKGNLHGSIRFSLDGQTPEATLDARTAAISRGDLSAKDVVIGAVIADYLSAPAISGKVRAATVTSGTTIIRDIDVDVDPRRRRGPASTAARRSATSRRPPRGGSRSPMARPSSNSHRGRRRFAASRPVAHASTIEIAGGTTTLDRLALNLGGGSVVVSGTAASALDLNATLSAVPASIANTFSPGLDAAGTISGTAKGHRRGVQPGGGLLYRLEGGSDVADAISRLWRHEHRLQR